MVQLLMADVPETDVQRIRCRSSNACGNRIVVFLWAILLSEIKFGKCSVKLHFAFENFWN